MSFISNLFGDSSTQTTTPTAPPAAPRPPPPAPRISDAAVEAADREARSRLAKRKGVEASVLAKPTSGLGDVTNTPAANLGRATLLGGAGVV
jgi:hypothetical protein